MSEFRVQYVDDVDPFNVLASIKHAEPTVARKYTFASDVALYDQIPAVKKLLRAPHKVSWNCLPRYFSVSSGRLCIYAAASNVYARYDVYIYGRYGMGGAVKNVLTVCCSTWG